MTRGIIRSMEKAKNKRMCEKLIKIVENIGLFATTFFGKIWMNFIFRRSVQKKLNFDDKALAAEQEYVAHDKYR